MKTPSTTVPASAGAPAERRPALLAPSLLGMLGLVLTALCLLMALFGPSLAPYDPAAIVDEEVFGAISSQFLLGTDYLGRDMLSRILVGARFTVALALAATLLASLTGTTLGLFAATAGGLVDATLSRALDALISIPSKMFALMMVASFGSSVPLLILTAAISFMPGSYRIARALAVNVQAMDFVQAARSRGEGMAYIMRVEILPNMIGPVLADFGLRFVFIVLLLSGLSFLSLGVQPPDADWGSLVRENIAGLSEGAPAVLMPALAIALLTIGVNLLIDNLRGGRAGKEG
ncbi:ABC transporter permease [Massilia niastensis]|uniref:ABC transporter permease n=1 Tax=Massilia niastensis TaxID=544911 RepID=UPI000477FBD1